MIRVLADRERNIRSVVVSESLRYKRYALVQRLV